MARLAYPTSSVLLYVPLSKGLSCTCGHTQNVDVLEQTCTVVTVLQALCREPIHRSHSILIQDFCM